MANEWGIEYWGPELVKTWAGILDKNKRQIKSFGFNEIPEAITVVPCVLNFIIESIDLDYSAGGLNQVIWRGKSEFYLSSDLKKSGLNDVYPFVKKIIDAAAKSTSLNGKVDSFLLKQSPTLAVAILNYGDEIDRYGLAVPWEVRENVTGKLIVGA